MEKISTKEIVDVLNFNDNSAIIVEKVPSMQVIGQYQASYYVVNFKTGKKEAITKNAYLLKKFGNNFKIITNTISNYIQCDTMIFNDRSVLVVYPNGQAGLFDDEGEVKWNGTLEYNKKIVSGVAQDNDNFWSICKDENSVIRYYCEKLKVDLRIGSKESKTFISPRHISSDNGDIYVCCDTNKVRIIHNNNFVVDDYMQFNQPVNKFYKFGNYSIICLQTATYLLNDADKKIM